MTELPNLYSSAHELWQQRRVGGGERGWFHVGARTNFTNAASCAHPPLLWPGPKQAEGWHWACGPVIGDPCNMISFLAKSLKVLERFHGEAFKGCHGKAEKLFLCLHFDQSKVKLLLVLGHMSFSLPALELPHTLFIALSWVV